MKNGVTVLVARPWSTWSFRDSVMLGHGGAARVAVSVRVSTVFVASSAPSSAAQPANRAVARNADPIVLLESIGPLVLSVRCHDFRGMPTLLFQVVAPMCGPIFGAGGGFAAGLNRRDAHGHDRRGRLSAPGPVPGLGALHQYGDLGRRQDFR